MADGNMEDSGGILGTYIEVICEAESCPHLLKYSPLFQNLLSCKSDLHIEDCGGHIHRLGTGSVDSVLVQTFSTQQQAASSFKKTEILVKLGQDWVVQPIFVSSSKPVVVYHDEAGYSTLRRQISQSLGRVDKVALQQLGATLGRMHNTTHTATMEPPQQQDLMNKFNDPDLIEKIAETVFGALYRDSSTLDDPVKNRITNLKANEGFNQKVADIRQLFDTRVECVIHGDFNADAVLSHEGKVKVATLDSTCIGPCAYDLGVIFAEYLIFYTTHMLTPENNDEHRQVSYVMMDACNRTAEAYFDNMKIAVNDRQQYVQTIISEAAGYAGIYIIKSILGPDPHPDLVGDGSRQLEALEVAVRLINRYEQILNAGKLAFIGLMLC